MLGGNGNAAKASVRDRAADEGDVLHSRQPNVGDELPAPAHEAIVFLPDQASTDTLCGRYGARGALGVVHRGVASAASRAVAVARGEGAFEWASRSMCSLITSLR
jgi:hypothetical protein